MSWRERDYNTSAYDGGGSLGWLRWLAFGSVPLGTLFGIRIRMHASLVLLIALQLIFAETPWGLGAKNALTSMCILFLSVLLHEFGHCFGARRMGGEAREILMWPLGGLAMTHPPHNWWAHLVTTACGPLVNLVICAATATALIVLSNYSASAVPWFPLRHGLTSYLPHDTLSYYIWWVFLVNYALLTFNLLMVFYPFDGGRLVQEVLWAFVGYYRSMRFATTVGMVGAVAVVAFGLVYWVLLLVLLGVFGFMACHRQRQVLAEMGPEGFEDADHAGSLRYDDAPRRRRINRRALRRAQRREARDRAEQARIDAILDKVSRHGMQSLNWFERRALRRATERQRELELSQRNKF